MSPLHSARSGKACDTCRKQKTRCHAPGPTEPGCLRCRTLGLACSLRPAEGSVPGLVDAASAYVGGAGVNSGTRGEGGSFWSSGTGDNSSSVEGRLERLERKMDFILDRLVLAGNHVAPPLPENASGESDAPQDNMLDGDDGRSAPVTMIQGVAHDLGVGSPKGHHRSVASESPVSARERLPDTLVGSLMTRHDAQNFLSIFYKHYTHWVMFRDSFTPDKLHSLDADCPFLLRTICLIAVRHTTQELVGRLAPSLFEETKSMLSSRLLCVPQPISYFQAIVLLTLWSSSIGLELLSIDSWILSGHALQQASASPCFGPVFRTVNPRAVPTIEQREMCCLWNHLLLAHLQYCVGTRRRSIINRNWLAKGEIVLNGDSVSEFEERMVAETRLYWIMYEKCTVFPVNLADIKRTLRKWREQFFPQINKPRSQFLRMGYNLSLILAYFQALKSPKYSNTSSCLNRPAIIVFMTHLTASIISFAISTIDDYLPHLTDHIYHMITFSAITLCGLLHSQERIIRAAATVPSPASTPSSTTTITNNSGKDNAHYHKNTPESIDNRGYAPAHDSLDIAYLDDLIDRVVRWMQSIGRTRHVANLLADIIVGWHTKLRGGADANIRTLAALGVSCPPFLHAHVPMGATAANPNTTNIANTNFAAFRATAPHPAAGVDPEAAAAAAVLSPLQGGPGPGPGSGPGSNPAATATPASLPTHTARPGAEDRYRFPTAAVPLAIEPVESSPFVAPGAGTDLFYTHFLGGTGDVGTMFEANEADLWNLGSEYGIDMGEMGKMGDMELDQGSGVGCGIDSRGRLL